MKADPQELFLFLWENRAAFKLNEEAHTRVLSVRPAVRTGRDGFILRETVAEYHQQITLFARELEAYGIAKPEGIEDLDPQQRVAWQFWASQFAYAWTLPPKGVTVGEKWKTEEPEDTPTAIANLVWERETTYVRNDKCPIIPSETCAVFLTSAKLKQKSSEEDATPDTYRLHNLKTSGTAQGTNETIRYISLKAHLVLRAKEDAQQSMDATVAKSDDSNAVRYLISSSSQFETTLIPAAALLATH